MLGDDASLSTIFSTLRGIIALKARLEYKSLTLEVYWSALDFIISMFGM